MRSREIARQQRCVVVAQILAEPAKPVGEPLRHDTQRQHERDVAVAEAADGDGGTNALLPPDQPIPGRKPIEGLKRGAIGDALEAPPFVFDFGQLAVDAHAELRRDFAPVPARLRESRRPDIVRRGRSPKRRQCGGACHSITAKKKGRMWLCDKRE